jgi:hypothetical protein
MYRGACIAGKPHRKAELHSLWLLIWLLTLKPAGRPLCSAFDLLLILI